MKQFAVAVMAIASLAGVSSAFAGVSDIKASNNQLGIQLISTKVDYTETNNGLFNGPLGTIDTETGRVPGIALSLSVMQDIWLGNDYLEAGHDHSSGHTDYTGGYLNPPTPYGSVTGTSSATLINYNVRYGKGVTVNDQWMLTPYAELGHHRWDRGVNLGEIYTHSYYGIGVLAQYSPASKLVFSANALAGHTFNSYIDVNGVFTGPLGDSALAKFGVAADYAFTRNIHANFGVDYTSFSYGVSDFYPYGAGAAGEPDSKTNYTTVRIGAGYSF
jgi:hypothetical protein